MRLFVGVLCVLSAQWLAFAGDEAPKPRRPRLQIINASEQTVDVFWRKSESERVPNGSISPGKDTVIDTTLGHRFVIVGRDDHAEAAITCEVPIQGFRFDPECHHGAPKIYTQSASADGFPIVATKNVNPFALKEAEYLIKMLLAKRPDVLNAMVKSGARLCILAHNEFTTDLPEFARLAEGEAPDPNLRRFSARDFWDARARGTGGSETDPYCSCGEENLLGYVGDPYSTECILIHEIAHNIHLRGMNNVDPTFDGRLKAAYRKAMDTGLWKGKYASVNHHEYFAEGVQSWFDNNRENDHDHNHVNTRTELLDYDPGLAALCREVFGDTELKYAKPATRLKDHLQGYDPKTAPRFVWPERLAEVKQAIRQGAEARNKSANAGSPAAETSPLLTIDRIFQSTEFHEEPLGANVWSKRSGSYFTLRAPAKVEEASEKSKPDANKRPGKDLVKIDAQTGKDEVLVPATAFTPAGATQPLNVDAYEFSADESKLLIYTNSQRVWRRNTRGDYWVLDLGTKELKKLGGDAAPATMMFAKFSPDGTRVAYVCKNNLFVQNLSDLKITPLTTDGSNHLINGTADWVNEEELDIRDGYRWSPDGKSIAFWQFDTTGVAEFFLVDNTSGSHSKTTGFAYPKVGGKNSATRVGVIDAGGGAVRWMDIAGDPREHYLARMEWTPDGKQLQIQQLNRLQNSHKVLLADPQSGATRVIHTESDDAWIENENPVRWLNEGRSYLWLSESDGWRHAKVIGIDGTTNTITPGPFDILKIETIDEKNGRFYYTASPDNPTQCYLYRASLNGGPPERLTPADQPGWHAYNISPNAEWAFHTYSTFATPPTVELIRLADHSVVRSLVTNQKLKDALAKLRLPRTEFLRLDVGNNVELDAWSIVPAEIEAGRKLPLVIHVYGEPHGQTVRDAWQGNRGLWHTMLAQQGFIVASVDNRGTMSPRGRAWRKCVYRQVGIQASQEQAAAVKALLQKYSFADPGRIGVWGWSGGGSMTLNAIFRYPDVYHTAISVAPVADQQLYDTIYQERYMGLPADNAEGYRNGSPITHAAQLKGNLLLIHGTGDDNCHYQGTEKLMNELIAHNKAFSTMPYPGRSHSISEGRNTTRHLYALMASYLHQHLMPSPEPNPMAKDSPTPRVSSN